MKPLLLLPVVLFPLAGCASPPPAITAEPACHREDVVAFVDGELRRRELYAELIRASVGERTAPSGTQSQCAAYARWVAFDADARGRAAVVADFPVYYTVRRAPYGFVVDLAPVVPPPRRN